MSVTIDWKGKIGYGDIISPICYAHNQADKLDTPVVLNFHFNHSPGTKFKEKDAETINDRVSFITKHTEASHNSVTVNQYYNSKLDVDHTNYSHHPISYHNLRFSSKYKWQGAQNYVVFITSTNNKKQFSQYAKGKQWKDPMSGKWENFVKDISKQYNVKLVHYETPIKEACKLISNAKIVVGYHGSAMWLARWIGAPMIVFSSRDFTKEVFPWCVHNPENFDLLFALGKSLDLKSKTLKKYNRYMIE
jgi:hypothetical protein